MIQFPENLEKFLLQYVKSMAFAQTKRAAWAEKDFNFKDLKYFAEGVLQLSQLFTARRGQLKVDYLNQKAFRAAYLLYFLPINFAKAVYTYQQFPQKFWQKKRFRLLDVGSGPGTASLAFLSELSQRQPKAEVELHLLDQNKNILQDAQAILQRVGQFFPSLREVSFRVQAASSQRVKLKQNYELMVFSNVINEFSRWKVFEKSHLIAQHFMPFLDPQGLLLILEPALQRPTRDLMMLRDELISEYPWQVLGPCLHSQLCPMLSATKKDWCHFYADWREPSYLKKLDRMIRNDNSHLKLAYLLLASKEYSIQPSHQNQFRVVSNRMATRGKTEVVLCGPRGRYRLRRLDRDRSPKNFGLDQVKRGDFIEVMVSNSKEFTDEGEIRLSKTQNFQKKG